MHARIASSPHEMASGQGPARAGRSRRVVAWVGVAGLLAAGGAAGAVLGSISLARSDAQTAHQAFTQAAGEIASNLRLGVQHEDDLIVSGGAFFKENPTAAPAAFQRWVGDVSASARYPELLGVAEIVVVPADRLAAWEQRVTRDPPLPNAPHTAFQVVPAGARPHYCFLAAEVSRVSEPIGADLCVASPQLYSSRDTGVTNHYAAMLPTGQQAFSASVPVYRGTSTPATVAGRRAAFIGWTGFILLPEVLLRQALQGHANVRVVLRRDDSAALTFASGKLPHPAQSIAIALRGGWSIQIFAPAASAGVWSNGNSLVLSIGGIVLSVLLGAQVLILATGRARALRLVSEKTGQLSFQAMHDGLTELPNRALVIDRAEQMLARARRQQTPIAALFVDVDGFKHVNDTFGHAAGDSFLRIIAERLSSVVRETDTVGRLGGDEFVALLEGETLSAGPELVADRLLAVLRQPFELEGAAGRPQSSTVSIGIAVGQRANAEELLRDADLALYMAKQAGKDRYIVFEESMQLASAERIALESDLGDALANDELFLLYQPTFDLQSQAVTGVEALIRWRHPTRGVVAPDLFIPLAEANAMIVPIGRWVLTEACRQGAAWHADGHEIGMSVNVSARQLERDEFVREVHDALADSSFDPGALTLEITEAVLMRDADAAAIRLQALKALGVRIAIDDFGTGYSSLAYLRKFPVDALKIDRSFIAGISNSQEAAALMRTLVGLGKALGLETLGEGIEEHAQLEQLKLEHCDSGQGFLLARPLDVEAITSFLDRSQLKV